MNNSYEQFKSTVATEFLSFVEQVDYDALSRVAALIQAARERGNRIHVSAIGKPAYVAGYIASLLSSTGTPTYFLHGTEAVHGSCGQLVAGDIVIFISNSGETAEMKSTVQAVENNGCAVIGITGNGSSWLARNSTAFLLCTAEKEGGPLNRAPRISILMETYMLQALSVLLQADANVSPQQYVKWHPGGSLGKLRENER